MKEIWIYDEHTNFRLMVKQMSLMSVPALYYIICEVHKPADL